MARVAIERSKLGQLTKIGQGGQGVVYRAPNVNTKFAASLVYKEYKAQTHEEIDFGALAAMPDLVENSLSYDDGERLVSMAAWPCAIVEDGGTPTGFVMPEIPDQFFISLTTLKGVSRNAAEFQHLLNPESVLDARGITIDDAQRYALLREVASGLMFLHSNGVCVGDVSPKNLLFSLEPLEAVYFIDCDAMRINDVSALPQVETPGWEVPPGEELATVYSDTYKLGLLALRLLAGDQDVKTPEHIPSTAPNLLRGLMTDTLTRPPDKRPLPESWTYILGHAIEEAQHRKKTAPAAPSPVKAATPAPPPPLAKGPEPSAPPPDPLDTAPWPTAKLWAGVAGVALFLMIIIALATGRSGSGSTASTNPMTYTTTYGGGYGGSTSYATTATTSSPSLFFGAPPNVLQGTDGGGDYRCNGGHPLPTSDGRVLVAPAAGSADGSYTSCGFAIRVGQAYLDSNPDYMSERRISVASPTAGCLQVKSGHSGVQCDGNNFWMVCQREGPDQAMWIACRGGNNAVVYIWA
jgi:serine/threonine protein kinase